MNKRNKAYNAIVFALAIALTASLTIFIISQIYSSVIPKIVEEINNSVIGAIFTAIITVFLLAHQSESEELKEKKAKVFEEKIKIFNTFLENLKIVISDSKISVERNNDELKELIFQLSYIKMHTSAKNTQEIINLLRELDKLLIGADVVEFDYQRFSEVLFSIVDVFQDELYSQNFGSVKIDVTELVKKVVTVDSELKKMFSTLEELNIYLAKDKSIMVKDFTINLFQAIDAYLNDNYLGQFEAFYGLESSKSGLVPKILYRMKFKSRTAELINIEAHAEWIDVRFPVGLEDYYSKFGENVLEWYYIEAEYQFDEKALKTIDKSVEFLKYMLSDDHTTHP